MQWHKSDSRTVVSNSWAKKWGYQYTLDTEGFTPLLSCKLNLRRHYRIGFREEVRIRFTLRRVDRVLVRLVNKFYLRIEPPHVGVLFNQRNPDDLIENSMSYCGSTQQIDRPPHQPRKEVLFDICTYVTIVYIYVTIHSTNVTSGTLRAIDSFVCNSLTAKGGASIRGLEPARRFKLSRAKNI
jgi:hypothetical protein